MKKQFLPRLCNHCDDPPCARNFPVDATYKVEDGGFVLQRYERCIRCRSCMAACPYNARFMLLIVSLLWIRNLSVYGGLDVMGLARPNAVVVGQPTTAQWLSDYGAGGLLQRFFATTYRSFWGQFGWMSTPMPDREYLRLGALSVVALIGWVWWLVERRNADRRMRNTVSTPAIILILLFVLTLGGYLYYNLTFVQHQGRYLFPALIPIGLAFAIGWWQILERIRGWLARRLSRSRRNWTPWLDQAQLIAFALNFIYLLRPSRH